MSFAARARFAPDRRRGAAAGGDPLWRVAGRGPAMTVGLYGGSFDPTHEGHVHVALTALRRLRLDEVWWLVSPGNPLKVRAGRMAAPLPDRVAGARAMAGHPRLRITTAEAALGTRFTVDTVAALRRRFPRIRFVWIMGADGLGDLHRWGGWRQLARMVPIAVIDRPGYGIRAMAGRAARTLAHHRLPEHRAGRLARLDPPAWILLHARLDPRSATDIREGRKPRPEGRPPRGRISPAPAASDGPEAGHRNRHG